MSTSQSSLTSNPTIKSILTIVGYIFGIAAGIAAVAAGVIQEEVGFIVIGVGFLAAVIVAIIAGAVAQPTGSIARREIGAKFTPPDWAWWVCAGILVVGCVIGGILIAT
ncbi:MAG: hypothetical protein ACOH16_12215 [Propionibacteriaceae bacterium]